MTDIIDSKQQPVNSETLVQPVESATAVTRSADQTTLETVFDITKLPIDRELGIQGVLQHAALLHHRLLGSHPLEKPEAHFAAWVSPDDVFATFVWCTSQGEMAVLNRRGTYDEVNIADTGVRLLKHFRAPSLRSGSRLLVGGVSAVDLTSISGNMDGVWPLGIQGSDNVKHELSLVDSMAHACREKLVEQHSEKSRGIASRAFRLLGGRTRQNPTPDVD